LWYPVIEICHVKFHIRLLSTIVKIALIYPFFLEERVHREEAAVVPLGLYYVAAMLKAYHFDVTILNWSDYRLSVEDIRRHLADLDPDLIGFSIVHANRWGAIDIAAWARELNPSIKIIFGGIGATFLWRHLLTHFPQIDYVVCGEGEHALLQLVQCITQGRELDGIGQIPGLAFRQSGQPRRNEPAPPIADLDRLVDPALFYDIQHLVLGRGCPGACRFCGSPAFWGRSVRLHSPGYFVDQIQRLCERGQRFFFFSDDTFTLDHARVISVCRQIIGRGMVIAWQAISRVDAVDSDVLYWMRRAGCIQISFGVESGSPRVRRALGKAFTDQQVIEAFDLTRRHGILPRAYFIYGCPGDSDQTMDQTLALIRASKPLAAIFYILDIFPGTALYRRHLKRCGVDDDIWLERIEDLLYFQTDPRLTAEMVGGFGRRLRDGFHQLLAGFADDIQLVDDETLYPCHADFLSRLAMTFDQGDYARIDAIPDREATAERLYRRALGFGPDARAFLGLGIMAQRRRDYGPSADVLEKGLDHFPEDRQLAACLAVSYVNQGRFSRARKLLEPMADDPAVVPLLTACRSQRR
jgi:radical SAM superfamily enzyme YgiQ (UPF0313 family)